MPTPQIDPFSRFDPHGRLLCEPRAASRLYSIFRLRPS